MCVCVLHNIMKSVHRLQQKVLEGEKMETPGDVCRVYSEAAC